MNDAEKQKMIDDDGDDDSNSSNAKTFYSKYIWSNSNQNNRYRK